MAYCQIKKAVSNKAYSMIPFLLNHGISIEKNLGGDTRNFSRRSVCIIGLCVAVIFSLSIIFSLSKEISNLENVQ